jgi:hypothetical protein
VEEEKEKRNIFHPSNKKVKPSIIGYRDLGF